MSATTDIVADILKKKGVWVETSALVDIIVKERSISPRQAYRDLKKSVENGEVKKFELPDGVVLNGLPNWGFPSTSPDKQKETLTFKDAFKYLSFKRLEKLSDENRHPNAIKTYNRLLDLIATLPAPQKEKLNTAKDEASRVWQEIMNVQFWEADPETWSKAMAINRSLIDKISKALHEI